MNDTSAASERSPILEICGVGRCEGGSWLIRDVSLSLRAGDRLALVGPSGSGKTVLLRAMVMLDPVQAGSVRWIGRTPLAHQVPQLRSRVMYLHQRPVLVEGTVEDNLRQPFQLGVHRDKAFSRERITRWLNELGRNETFLSKQQGDLSGGESQLTALLRAIQLDPELLLLDEPTAALDADAEATVETLVRRWLDQQPGQRATVWVCHDTAQARRVSTAIWQMRNGHLESPL